MKYFTVILIFVFFPQIGITQDSLSCSSSSISFEDTTELKYILFDTTNIWQIKKPNKDILFLPPDTSNLYALVTDTNLYYSDSICSYFQIKFSGYYCPHRTGYIISFNHKYDFELNKDGGIIETSYDGGVTWNNILLEDMIELDYNFGVINLYNLSDTISSYNNQPGFTGTQYNYTCVDIPFRPVLWVANLLIRFIISTDSVNMNNEGWMIDELSFGWYDFWDIKDVDNNKHLFIYPNPSNNNFTITSKDIIINKIEILDLNGKILKTELLTNNINVGDLLSGVYLIRINDELIRKIIVQ